MSSGRVTLHQADVASSPPVAAEFKPTAGSIVARLRENAKAQQEVKTTEIAVGGEFGDRLWIQYGVLGPDEMDRFVAARQGIRIQDISATSATMDMMARACKCVIGRYEGEEEVLRDSDGPVRLEDRLARMLSLRSPDEPVLPAYEVIARLFGRNGAMLSDHGDRLATWMQNPAEETSVGEFSGTVG
jgi:hypothetical protein